MIWQRDDADYPQALNDLPDPPKRVWVEGKPEVLSRTAIAVVGTRSPSPYGMHIARQFGEALARAGACVVSGMAAGIDTAVHEAVLDAGGATCAVLGTGIDLIYPVINTRLRARIAESGLLMSEYAPGTRAAPWTFPKRNRLIAALARATIVVEAGQASGALITATFANDLSRAVAAVPGPINAIQSRGSNELLRDGAIVLTSAQEAVMLIGPRVTVPTKTPKSLPQGQVKVWEALADGGADYDTIALKTQMPISECMSAISELEMAGYVNDFMGEVRRL